jgi:hypothetical protein
MPRRASPGHRERIERALTPDLRDGLETLRELLDLHDWRLSPLGPPFTAAAAVLMAADLIRDGMAPHTALERTCAHLRISPDTARTWFRRWPARSRGVQHEHTGRGASGLYLLEDAARAPETEAEK